MAEVRQSLSAEVMGLRLKAENTSAKLRRRLRNAVLLSRAYRRTFFDAQGKLRPEARMVLEDLIETAGIGQALPDLEHAPLALMEGERRIVLHVFGRFKLPQGRLDQLERELTQAEETE